MSVSDLQLTYTTLRQAVGVFLGYGRTVVNWSTAQENRINDIVECGTRQVYWPSSGHEWSFLKPSDTIYVWGDIAVGTATVTGVYAAPTTTLTASEASFYESMVDKSIVITGTGTYTIAGYTSTTVVTITADATCAAKTFSIASNGNFRLPDDFGGLSGNLTFVTEQAGRCPIRVVGPSLIERKRQQDTSSSGTPRLAAFRPKPAEASGAQYWELMIWPEPDGEYEMNYTYNIRPDKLGATQLYHYGGVELSECLRQSCLAVAEQDADDVAGVHTQLFDKLLAAAIENDLRTKQPKVLGYNADHSVNLNSRRGLRNQHYDCINVTVDGILY